MSGLQTIIDNASAIQIDRRKLAGHTISRSGRVKTVGVASAIPWQFAVTMHDGLEYSENRALLEELDRIDRVLPSTIDIGASNPGLSYITEYSGPLTGTQLDNTSIQGVSGDQLVLDVSAITNVSSQTVLFAKGDYIQPGSSTLRDYPYPYTVVDDVVRGSGNTVTIGLNRPFIPSSSVDPVSSNYGLRVGTDVTWTVIMLTKPSYSLLPGNRISWATEFELLEVIQ